MEIREQRHEGVNLERLVSRLGGALAVDLAELATVRSLWRTAQHHRARSFVSANAGVRLITSGWAGWIRELGDGKRPIFLFLLPGDFIIPGIPEEEIGCHVVCLTPLRTVDAVPLLARGNDGAPVAPRSAALIARTGRDYRLLLLDQLTRLASGNSTSRIAHLLLELHMRMEAAGCCEEGRFDLPIGQRVIGQALGRSAVQINRCFAELRADSMMRFGTNWVQLMNVERLERLGGLGRRAAPTVESRPWTPIRPVEVRPDEVRPVEVRPDEVRRRVAA